MEVSVVITAFRESQTIGRAVKAIGKVKQLLVVAPDKETLTAAREANPQVELIQDRGKGKPAALNLALKRVKGEIVVLTDGDVWPEKGAIKALLKPFADSQVGIVSGRPVPLNSKDTLFGFWAYLLTETAHQLRQEKEYFDCSGYLLAFRKKLWSALPPSLLAEDSFLSRKIYQQGYKTAYAPEARVFVKFPTNFSDWLKQKVRSVGGAARRKGDLVPAMRGFWPELKEAWRMWRLCTGIRQYFFLLLLWLARLYLWLLIFYRLRIRRFSFQKIWQRVESTKKI